eukprot:m.16078 g.16078  ORF g.16078 m.16078 type:complete len:504 (+) comp26730_c0_seq2:51-1562(+)
MANDPKLPWLTIGDRSEPWQRHQTRSPQSSSSLAAHSSGFGSSFHSNASRSRASVYSSRPSSGYGSTLSLPAQGRPKSAPPSLLVTEDRKLTRPRSGILRFAGPRPTIHSNSIKPKGYVEFCCIVRQAKLHERSGPKKAKTRPESPDVPLLVKGESKPPPRISFAWAEVKEDSEEEKKSPSESEEEETEAIQPSDLSLQPVLEEEIEPVLTENKSVRFELEEEEEEEIEKEDIVVEDIDAEDFEVEAEDPVQEEEKQEEDEQSEIIPPEKPVELPTVEVKEEPKVKKKLARKPKKEKSQQPQRKTEAVIPKRKWKGLPKQEEPEYEPPQLKPLSPWLKHRFALSKKSCRFELPVDMKLLEDLSPLDYLRSFCVIGKRRKAWYSKVFRSADRARQISNGLLNMKEVENALMEVHFNSSTKDQIGEVMKIACISEDARLDKEQFLGLAALSERMLVASFLSYKSAEDRGAERDILESTDFEAIDWKLRGVEIRPNLRHLFDRLQS